MFPGWFSRFACNEHEALASLALRCIGGLSDLPGFLALGVEVQIAALLVFVEVIRSTWLRIAAGVPLLRAPKKIEEGPFEGGEAGALPVEMTTSK